MKTTRLAAVALLAASSLTVSTFASAQEKPPADATPSQVCATCHGADGNSVIPQYPSLAGQHASYIEKQLRDFKSGARKSPIMGPIAKQLSDEQIKKWADFFAQQERTPQPARDASLVAAGEKLYRGGNETEGVPACAGCHLPTGAGIPGAYPRLAGQFAEYVVTQLKAFRAEERANDASKAMRAIASRMSEDEMRAVAEYLRGLR
ncbi:MAG: c-type cytochrome [Burkholderiales bacterium]